MSAAPLLIVCEACGKQFSKKASACPGCANPNDAYGAGAISGKTTTIEQTSKKYKKGLIVSIVLIVCGFTIISTSQTFGSLMVGAGIITFLWSRIGAWWNNG